MSLVFSPLCDPDHRARTRRRRSASRCGQSERQSASTGRAREAGQRKQQLRQSSGGLRPGSTSSSSPPSSRGGRPRSEETSSSFMTGGSWARQKPRGAVKEPPYCYEYNWKADEAALKRVWAKDRVAFMLYRAPQASYASPRLQRLEAFTPEAPKQSTSHSSHEVPSKRALGADVFFGKGRDQMSVYREAQLMAENIGFRKHAMT
eukprot:TRINITY_DN80043_c0_g1_i1.p2 TRINITY_DN80043_c0_g1~~TRINITY_DN80043_c0_g1_i1.p2  ORF type:complete len:205 (-),score=46.69 TRINITY_DN80043_c0_g1_i1:64-678(-)